MRKNTSNRIVSLLLSAVLAFGSVDVTAFASEAVEMQTQTEETAEMEKQTQTGEEVECETQIETEQNTEKDSEQESKVEQETQVIESEIEDTLQSGESKTQKSEQGIDMGVETEGIETSEEKVSNEEELNATETSGTCGDNLTWNFDENTGTLTITGSGDMYDYDQYGIPWMTYRYKITNIVFANDSNGEGITRIGNFAFLQCSRLMSNLKLPPSVTSIGSYAFSGCSKLTELELPSGVLNIEDYAFRSSGLTGKLRLPSSLISIGRNAFSDCRKLTELELPSSLTNIGAFAFSGCSGLTGRLELPSSWTSTGFGTFLGCSKLTELELPSSLTNIESQAFGNCSGLTGELKLPSGVTSIGSFAFENCSGLTGELKLPSGVTSIGESAFQGCSGLTGRLKLPSGLKEIRFNAFQDCTGLTGYIYIPKSVKTIMSGAFWGCSNMKRDIYIQNADVDLSSDCFALMGSKDLSVVITIHASKGSTAQIFVSSSPRYAFEEWDGSTFPDDFYDDEPNNPDPSNKGLNINAQVPNDEFWIVLQDVNGNAITKAMFTSAGGDITTVKDKLSGGKLEFAFEDVEGLGVVKVKNMVKRAGSTQKIKVEGTLPAQGFPTSISSQFDASGGQWDIMTIDKFKNPCIGIVNVTDSREKTVNMLHQCAIFYKGGKTQYPLEISISYAADIPGKYSYRLVMIDDKSYQETVLDTFEGNNNILLDITKLPQNETESNLFLQVFLDDSKLCQAKIRAAVVKKMPEIPENERITVGSGLELTMPEDIPIFGGSTMEFDLTTDVPVKIFTDVREDGNTWVQMVGSLGMDTGSLDSWLDTLNGDIDLSNFVGTAKKKFLEQYDPSNLDLVGHKEVAGMDVGVQFAVYLEGLMKPGSKEVYMELRVVGELKVENSVTYSTVIGPVPVYVAIGGEIKDNADGELHNFKIALDDDFKITAPDSAEFKNTLELSVKPKAGVGVNGVVDAYVEGDGTFKWETKLSSDELSWENIVWLTLTLSMGVTVLCFNFEKKLAETEPGIPLYPRNNGKARTADIPFETAMYDASNYDVMQRDYELEGDAAVTAYNAVRSANSNVLINGMYPDAKPKYISYNGADYLFYLEDQTERAVEDKSTLVYRVNTGTGWSSAKAVNDDGTADFAYDVTAGSDGIYIAWQNAAKSLAGVGSIPEVMEQITLSAAKLSDGNISLLETPKNEDGLAPVMVSLAADNDKVWLYWLANTENDLLNNSNGNNIIYRTEAGSTQIQKLAETDHGITTLASGILNGELCAAVTADTDGKQDTVEDREIYLIKDDGMTALTDNEVMDSNPQFGRIGQEQAVIYYSENNFMRSNGTNVVPIFDKEYKNISSDNFRLACDGSNAVIIWPETYATAEKMGYSLAMTAYRDGSWTAPANAAQLDNTLVDFTVKAYDGGKARLYYTELDESGDSAITRLYEAEARQIGRAVFSGVLYDAESYVSGSALPLTVGIYNDGTCEVSDCSVTIEDSKGNTVYTRNQISAPSAGKATELEITDFIPENQAYENYRIQLICDGNVCDIRDLEIGGAEYTISYSTKYEAVTEYDGADEERLYVTISNDSNFKGDVKLVITGGESGEVLYENTYEGLEPGSSANYLCSLTQLWEQTPDRYIILTAQSLDREEPYLMDNSVSVFNYKRMDAKVKVALDRNEAELTAGETLQLNASVQAKEGADTTLRWESRDSEYATVDQNGLVTAIKPGLTLITVWTVDGGRSTCYVKVLPKEDVQSEHTITYYDGTQQIVMEPSVFKENEEILLLVPYKEGYDFAGWYETPDFSGSAVERILKGTVTDKVFYAKWTKRSKPGHMITYYDGTQQITIEPSVFKEDEEVLLPEPYKAGYDFAGWYETPDFSGSVIEWIPEGTTTDKVFYAKWAERVREKNDAKTETSLSVEFAGTGIYTYTGAAVKPKVIVRDEGQILRQGRDYTVSYKNNTQAATAVSTIAQQGIAPFVDSGKAPMVLITGKGNYKGKKAAAMNFTIRAKELSDTSIVLTCENSMPLKAAKGGYADQQLAAVVKDGKKSLNKAKDYVITYDYLGEDGSKTPTGADKDMTAVNKPGVYMVYISARIAKDSSGRMIRSAAKNNASNANYAGNIEPFILYVQDSAKILSKAKITLANTKGIQQGIADITLEQVLKSITFGSGKNAEVYATDTVEKMAAFAEKFDVAGLDTLTAKAGTGYITVTAKAGSGYFGSKRVAVKILGTPLSKAVFTQTGNSTAFTYNGTVQAPAYTLQISGTSPATLTEGKDYTITYQKEKTTVLSPVAAGSYTATYTGIGAYTGTVKKTFKIAPLDLAAAYKADKNAITVTASSAPYNPKGAVPAEVTVAYTPAGGTALTLAAEDYTITCSQNKVIGKGSITLNAKGNYKGTIKNIMTYDIVAKSMASDDITVEVEDVFYKAGADIAPKLTVYDNGVKVNAKDYTVAFADGSAKLTGYQLPDGAEYADIDLIVTANAGKNYTEGTKASAKLHIYTKKISNATVVLAPNDKDNNYYYTGQQIKPALQSVTYQESKNAQKIALANSETEGYLVKYGTNTKTGSASVTIYGTGKYGGSKTVKFIIYPKWMKWMFG